MSSDYFRFYGQEPPAEFVAQVRRDALRLARLHIGWAYRQVFTSNRSLLAPWRWRRHRVVRLEVGFGSAD
jgi:hypothetical protein